MRVYIPDLCNNIVLRDKEMNAGISFRTVHTITLLKRLSCLNIGTTLGTSPFSFICVGLCLLLSLTVIPLTLWYKMVHLSVFLKKDDDDCLYGHR